MSQSSASKFSIKSLASAGIFYYATLWLIVLVVIGTIAQKYSGLQFCLDKYFSSWWIQPLDMPFVVVPGGRLTMAIIMVNLTAKLIFSTKWKWKMIGINITHIGVMILMIGGVVTAYTTIEGNVALKEGEQANQFSAFHELEIAVIDRSSADEDKVTAFSDGFFRVNEPFSADSLPLKFNILEYYPNCEPTARKESEVNDKLINRAAQNFKLKALTHDAKDQNLAGMMVDISGLKEGQNGTYMLLNSPGLPRISVTAEDGKEYEIILQRRVYKLPFTIKLDTFTRELHAGTSMASAYSSMVEVIEGDTHENVKIYMNHPLRRHGFTFYQASFAQGERNTSILQVVYNDGESLPYYAIITIALGLLLHLVIQLPRLIVAAKQKA